MTLLSSLSSAGDLKEKGFVLKEDSYVFSIEEAERLKNRIIELESIEIELNSLKKINVINEKTIDLYKINENLFSKQIDNYKYISDINDEIIKKYNDQNKYNDLKTAGYFSLGIITTIGSFLIADHISDSFISNN
ncbi:hypothetical protein N9W84_00265 [bacterium]|nr:hypothetical protein [bacterium]